MSIQDQLIEYMTQDVVNMIVENQDTDYVDAMKKFYNSTVFDKLQNKQTGLYRESPSYVYDLYVDEMNFGHIVQTEI